MGTYRKEWDCCGSVTETEGWEPAKCPFCSDDSAKIIEDLNTEILNLKSELKDAWFEASLRHNGN